MDRDFRVLDSQAFQNLPGLRQNRVPIIRSDPRFEAKLDSAGVARLNGNVKVGANFFTPMSSFGGLGLSRAHANCLWAVAIDWLPQEDSSYGISVESMPCPSWFLQLGQDGIG